MDFKKKCKGSSPSPTSRKRLRVKKMNLEYMIPTEGDQNTRVQLVPDKDGRLELLGQRQFVHHQRKEDSMTSRR